MTTVRARFVYRLFASYVLLIAVTALLAQVFVARWIEGDTRRSIEDSLAAQAALLVEAVPEFAQDPAELQRSIGRLGAATRTRLTVVARDGRVLADSAERPEVMENHLARPEFAAARASGRGAAERVSATTGVRTIYLCLAVPENPGGIGFVRASLAFPDLATRIARLRDAMLAGVAVATLLALLVALYLARRLSRPLGEMTRAALRLAEGDRNATIAHAGNDELGELAHAFNRMSVRLRERMAELERERAKLETVLESMAEGVVAVDADERLIHCNAAARAMLSIAEDGGFGRPLVERVRTPELVETLRRVQGASAPASTTQEVRVLVSGRERVVAVHVARLADAGAVAVLLDVTELRRLETVRSDFVANVSHEIKTPLAAMRGLVETLVEDEAMDPAVRRRFLGKLGDHVRRLSDLATDLLHLSRAESEARPRVDLDVVQAATAAAERFAAAAASKQLDLRCELQAAPVVVSGDPEAMVQILDNLLDNAIKYTPPGGKIVVRVRREDSVAVIEVTDTGVGIEPAEQKRVFERFYRVDKARSRDVPGTGLGLSIVKHLVDAHGGAVELESWPGRGATFRVSLPGAEIPAAGAAPVTPHS